MAKTLELSDQEMGALFFAVMNTIPLTFAIANAGRFCWEYSHGETPIERTLADLRDKLAAELGK